MAANTYRRDVNIEWEPVSDANYYELELKPLLQDERNYNFRTKSAQWKGKLKVGNYQMRARTFDRRGVPGEWSEFSDFDVLLDSTKIISPFSGQAITVTKSGETKADVTFEWEKVEGAESYRIQVSGQHSGFAIDEVVSGINLERTLPVAEKYSWRVTGLGENALKSEPNQEYQFSIHGPKIEKIRFLAPESQFVREIKLENPVSAGYLELVISRWNPDLLKWESVKSSKLETEESIPFDANWVGGKYRVVGTSHGRLRPSSEQAIIEFEVHDGDRSKSSEFNHEIRQSIDRASGWYGTAGYHISQLEYSSKNYDHALPAQTTYSTLSGVSRLGLGYFSDKSNYGFLGLVESSATNTNQGYVTTNSSELSLVWRKRPTELSDLRLHFGAFYREYLVSESDGLTQTVLSFSTASVLGAHLGAEYWYSLTPKYGFQINFRLYEALAKISTPNGQSIEPTLATQLGMLISYKFSRNFSCLLGIASRGDSVRYRSVSSDPRFTNAVNSVDIKGVFLNIDTVYDF